MSGIQSVHILVGSVKLNSIAIQNAVISADITMSEGAHDQVILRFLGDASSAYGNGIGSLIAFAWGHNGAGRFNGYVTDITSERQSDTTYLNTVITAMGPTFVMKSGRPRFFTDFSVADVAAQIAAEYQLGFRDEYGTEQYTWRTLAQTDESDWEFLTNLCDKIGASLVCSPGGVLRLINPMSVLVRHQPMLFFTAMKDDGNPTMYDFAPAHYSNRLPSQFAPTVSYMANKQVVTVRQSTPGLVQVPTIYSAEVPIANQTEAKLAQIRMPVDWEEQATARFEGDTRLTPGSVVQVRSGTRTVVTLPYDGYWYIMDVTHTLTDQMFQSKVSLARVTNAPRFPPIPPNQWTADPRGRPQLVASSTGNWISTWR